MSAFMVLLVGIAVFVLIFGNKMDALRILATIMIA